MNGFWFLCTLRCIFFHQKCHVLIVSLPGRILSPLPFPPSPPQGQPRHGRGIGHGFSSCCFRLATSSSTLASNPKNTRARGQIAEEERPAGVLQNSFNEPMSRFKSQFTYIILRTPSLRNQRLPASSDWK